MRKGRFLGALLATSLVAAACGGSIQLDSVTPPTEQQSTESTTTMDSTTAPSTTASATTSSSPTTTGSTRTTAAPAGELVQLVGGGQIDLNSIEGQDTVLWFWAPW